MLLIGRKLPTVQPRAFQAAGDRVLVGLWADTMEGRPTRWWTVLTVRDGAVTAIEDYTVTVMPCARSLRTSRRSDSEVAAGG